MAAEKPRPNNNINNNKHTDLDAERASPIHVYAAKQLMHGACMAWPAGEVHRDSNATVISTTSSGEP